MPQNNRSLLKLIGFGAVSALGGYYLSRTAFGLLTRRTLYPTFTQKLENNLWELAGPAKRMGANILVENELRSSRGRIIKRPIGGPKKLKFLESIMFNPAQVETLPAPKETKVNTKTTIGPLAQKPLELQIPLLIGGMAFGLALSEQFKIAIARAASTVGTATNTGQGPCLQSERQAADKLIIQYPRGNWNRDEAVLKQADAIEIQLGQGANAGLGTVMKSSEMTQKTRQTLGLKKGQDAVVHNRLEEATSPEKLKSLVSYLQDITGGVPVGAKIAAGKYLEQDLQELVNAGVDFISIDGAEGGTHGSSPVTEDDFGLPTLITMSRAARFWEKHNLRGKISLLIGGGACLSG